MHDDVRRRDLLRTGAGLAGTAVLGGLAGCLGSIPGLGGGGGVPGYTNWLPAGGELGREADGYRFGHVDVAGIRDNEDHFEDETYDAFEESFESSESLLPEVETVDAVTLGVVEVTSQLVVVEGSFSVQAAIDEITDTGGYEEDGEYGDYTLYASLRGTVGVADGVLAGAFTAGDARTWVETLVDAGNGDVERLVTASGDLAVLTEELGVDLSVSCAPGGREDMPDGYSPDDVAASGVSVGLDGDTARVEEVLVYEDESAVDPDAIEDAAADAGGSIGDADDHSVSASGRVATVEGTAEADELGVSTFGIVVNDDAADDRPTAVPSASFDFDYNPNAGGVTITHSSGDTFTAENTAALRYGVRSDRLDRWSLPVSAGDTATLRPSGGFDGGEAVVVVWEARDGTRTATIAEFEIPA